MAPLDPPPINPNHMVRFVALLSVMTDDEREMWKQIAADLSPLELREWLARMSAVSFPDALKTLRGRCMASTQTLGAFF